MRRPRVPIAFIVVAKKFLKEESTTPTVYSGFGKPPADPSKNHDVLAAARRLQCRALGLENDVISLVVMPELVLKVTSSAPGDAASAASRSQSLRAWSCRSDAVARSASRPDIDSPIGRQVGDVAGNHGLHSTAVVQIEDSFLYLHEQSNRTIQGRAQRGHRGKAPSCIRFQPSHPRSARSRGRGATAYSRPSADFRSPRRARSPPPGKLQTSLNPEEMKPCRARLHSS